MGDPFFLTPSYPFFDPFFPGGKITATINTKIKKPTPSILEITKFRGWLLLL
jgi:hypothetical protein